MARSATITAHCLAGAALLFAALPTKAAGQDPVHRSSWAAGFQLPRAELRSLFDGVVVGKVELRRQGADVMGQNSILEDRSIGAAGLLGNTTNDVVPIPGTDMIRVGVLQEGSFTSNDFRSGAQEAANSGGAPGAVLIFVIVRPVISLPATLRP